MKVRVVRVMGASDGGSTPHDGRYVVRWDSDVEAGTLALDSTDDLDKARRFVNGEEFDEWRAVSKVQPRRPWDGHYNRPLTAITIEIIDLDVAMRGVGAVAFEILMWSVALVAAYHAGNWLGSVLLPIKALTAIALRNV
jgi:hypothetical protein